jgi:hypothetical protein
MKKTIILLLLAITFACSAQSPFKGFFKPVKQNVTLKSALLGSGTSTWLFRPTVSVDAIKLQYVGGEQSFVTSTLQTLGTGISYQNFIDQNGTPYCQLAVNGLVLYNLDLATGTPINLGAGITVGAFNNLISVGAGWFTKEQYPCIFLNVSVNLNK